MNSNILDNVNHMSTCFNDRAASMSDPSTNVKPGFSEFSQMMKDIELLSKLEVSMIEYDKNGFSVDFKKFIDSQPQDISEGLLQILKAGEDQVKVMQTYHETMGSFPSDMKAVSTLKSQLDKKISDLRARQDSAKKAKNAAQKAEETLAKTRTKGKPDEIDKAETALSTANQKAISDQKAAEDCLTDFEAYYEDYKSKVIDTISTIMSAAINTREKTLVSLQEISNQVSQAILQVHQPHDTVIDNLQKRLEDLENVIIE